MDDDEFELYHLLFILHVCFGIVSYFLIFYFLSTFFSFFYFFIYPFYIFLLSSRLLCSSSKDPSQ